MADRYAKLRAASLAITGWDGINQSWRGDDRDGCDVMFEVGAINDGEKYPVAVIDADIYGTDGESQKLAHYYAEANAQAIRALLADFDEASARAFYETSVAQAAIEQVKVLEAERDRLRQAAHQMHALYPNVWDRTDGGLVVFPENVERFDAAFEALGAALAQEQGDSDAQGH